MPKVCSASPCFPVADIGATIGWYEQRLGFRGESFPETEPYQFGFIERDDLVIMLQRLEGYQKPDLYSRRGDGVWDAYIRVTGLKEFYDSVRDRVTILSPLRLKFYGAWEFEVKDPNGYVLVFSENE
jgi:predicted enzyme related to lactoylglutathione lyase